MSRIKVSITLALVAASVLGVTASSAVANNFKAAKYPVKVKAEAKNDQGFKIAGAVAVCTKAKFKGEATKESETLEVHPEYTGCEVELGGTHLAKVTTTGCNFLFHDTPANSVDIVCEVGKTIVVKVEGLNCLIEVGSQNGLKTIEYVNEAGGKVKVKANVTGISYKTNCPIEPKEGKTGEYREGGFNAAKEPVLREEPAKALAEGTFGELEEVDPIEA